jgi:hypothetical protein
MGGSPSDCYAKEWNSVFSEDRNFKEDQTTWDINADGHDFGIFLQASESSVPFSRVEEIQEYCQGVRLENLKSGTCLTGRGAAWLDDRSFDLRKGVGSAREYENPLSASSLYLSLNIPVWNEPSSHFREPSGLMELSAAI